MPEEEVFRILDEVESLTPNTILDKKVVMEKNRELRQLGYSLSVSEREQGVSSVAVPFFDASPQPGMLTFRSTARSRRDGSGCSFPP
jgi:DNA-binding IclR family transcriptional regulator